MSNQDKLEGDLSRLHLPSERRDIDQIENVRWLMSNWKFENGVSQGQEALISFRLRKQLNKLVNY